jgi:uncharacterized protein (DUF2384 family)
MRKQKIPIVSMLAVKAGAVPDFERSGRDAVRRIVAAFGNSTAARLLGVDRAQVSRWNHGKDPLSPEMLRRVLDFEYILNRLLQVFAPDVAGGWLVGSEPLLGGARPLDVLFLRGSAPVIEALDGIVKGVHA